MIVERGGRRQAGTAGRAGDALVVSGPPPRSVGRGGEEARRALDALQHRRRGRRVLDVGASTGGFTDCLLATRGGSVVAVDVGYGSCTNASARTSGDRARANEHARRPPETIGGLSTSWSSTCVHFACRRAYPCSSGCAGRTPWSARQAAVRGRSRRGRSGSGHHHRPGDHAGTRGGQHRRGPGPGAAIIGVAGLADHRRARATRSSSSSPGPRRRRPLTRGGCRRSPGAPGGRRPGPTDRVAAGRAGSRPAPVKSPTTPTHLGLADLAPSCRSAAPTWSSASAATARCSEPSPRRRRPRAGVGVNVGELGYSRRSIRRGAARPRAIPRRHGPRRAYSTNG